MDVYIVQVPLVSSLDQHQALHLQVPKFISNNQILINKYLKKKLL